MLDVDLQSRLQLHLNMATATRCAELCKMLTSQDHSLEGCMLFCYPYSLHLAMCICLSRCKQQHWQFRDDKVTVHILARQYSLHLQLKLHKHGVCKPAWLRPETVRDWMCLWPGRSCDTQTNSSALTLRCTCFECETCSASFCDAAAHAWQNAGSA